MTDVMNKNTETRTFWRHFLKSINYDDIYDDNKIINLDLEKKVNIDLFSVIENNVNDKYKIESDVINVLEAWNEIIQEFDVGESLMISLNVGNHLKILHVRNSLILNLKFDSCSNKALEKTDFFHFMSKSFLWRRTTTRNTSIWHSIPNNKNFAAFRIFFDRIK